MSRAEAGTMDAVQSWLESRGVCVDRNGDGVLGFEAARDQCLVEVDPTGSVRCQFGVDLDELRDLIAGSATEDLGEDELVRAARYHLQTIAKPYAARLIAGGFAEEYEVTADHAVIGYVHPVDFSKPENVLSALDRCLGILGS
ncbi:MAG: hypothetical protein AB1451_08810 [Nitrospirota bacterium]